MRTDDLDSAANEQGEKEKVKEVSQSHPQWEPELECVIHNAKAAGNSAKAECNGRYLSRMLALVDGIYQGAVGRAWVENILHKQNAGCRFLRFASGIAVDVQQRLNCALP